ncbi:uncharacterized protein PHACADRAFT_249387 [Phanerochaete carnosa HHB-10118-sp]|uniref:Cyclin N-terminal domain-containing protein n=1 Tax=Phanerochaete carnosa (strain HHB-10118-sp) TaxID=650164 RepID=K5X8D0_PHACS|nr:uncharacterized protein PHACADRAFT_249387 [Phanerochaete carnosa HHB-10118-sp]EKM59142.1 hypothetical protein PHACADRAFT_249387 [Phanerochaete carnosa HHB-10118-sp]
MPVPVPVYTKPPAHPVIKSNRAQAGDPNLVRSSVFQSLTNSLPLPPQGPPPAFASREEWISSLPSWRRNKPRRIWEEDIRDSSRQGFREGLAVAGNAAASKGAPAQAGIPPVSTLLASTDNINRSTAQVMYESLDENVDDAISSADSVLGWHGEDTAQYTDDGDMSMELVSDSGSIACTTGSSRRMHTDEDLYFDSSYPANYERGAFSPVYEESSPERDVGSSPVGPNTPFGDYVDRAVASQAVPTHHVSADPAPQPQYAYTDDYCHAQCYQCQHFASAEHVIQQAPPAPEPVQTPTASATYKKLAEPLADWVANFVWKVCTTGLSMSPKYAQPDAYPTKRYSSQPPSHLARSTHSMLLSTLLQPSAVFLAMWYIVRLPVFFGPVNLGPGDVREMRFRAELLGEPHMPLDRDAIESFVPFRLVLLGCMLANKWLDDHTFSNKTWHTISNVPVRSLNKLESLALDIFGHDLSIPSREWSLWLTKIQSYHASLSSPAFPQPISRPSSSPHNIIRKAIEDLMDATVAAEEHLVNGTPEPVFFSLEGLRNETSDSRASEEDLDVLEIDLDEDGPLREEYLPKRRTSGAGSSRPARLQERSLDIDKNLPPPAKWSPAADEPIFRYNARPQQYVAPQPISQGHLIPAPAPPPAPFHQALDMSRRIWPVDEQIARQPYAAPPPPLPVFTAPHAAYPAYDYRYAQPVPPPPHSRAQSLSFNNVTGQPQGHYRSYSQVRYDNDMAYPQSRHPVPPARWPAPFSRAVFPPLHDSYLYDYRSRPLVKV